MLCVKPGRGRSKEDFPADMREDPRSLASLGSSSKSENWREVELWGSSEGWEVSPRKALGLSVLCQCTAYGTKLPG